MIRHVTFGYLIHDELLSTFVCFTMCQRRFQCQNPGGDISKIPTAEDNFHALTLQLLEHKHSDFEDSLDSGSMYIV